MQLPILSGIYASPAPDYRTGLPRNYIAVPKATGISNGYLRPCEGIAAFATGQGSDRGGINWNGACYRISGTKLVRVTEAGAVVVLGDVGLGGAVSLDYSFDRLIIASGGNLYYWGGTSLTQVTDPDLGAVVDACWIGGYTMTTDGTNLVVTELNDPTAVNPLKYGSAESDPDPIMAVDRIRTEAYALGRYTIEAFQNVGGDLFPFQRIEGAQVQRGIVGTHAYCKVSSTFAFTGGGRNEPVGVYLMTPGDSLKISTREVDVLLQGYTESQLSAIVMEPRVDAAHELVLIHLPDRCLVYDLAASKVLGEPIWHTRDSGLLSYAQYRARNAVWCYDRWIVGDPASSSIGTLTDTLSSHFGSVVGWEFGTAIIYNGGNGAVMHEIEMVALPGRVPLGVDPTVWTSYSTDGETWGQERPAAVGKQGQRDKRIAWRRLGRMDHVRMQRFRGTSDAHLPVSRIEAQVEPLVTKGGVSG